MIQALKCTFVLFLLSGAYHAFRFSLEPDYQNIKICRSPNTNCSHTTSDKNLVLYYEKLYSRCTHIIGNLVLCSIKRLENGSDPDLSFLNSIREVSGYVFISGNEVRRIPLTSLRIIRGHVPYHFNGKDVSLYIARNGKSYESGLEVLDLRNLTVIQAHNIVVWDNPFLCHFQFTVDIKSLFVNPTKQIRIPMNKNDSISSFGCDFEKTFCHKDCTSGHCWGPEADQCQTIAKCGDDSSKYCRFDKEEDFCDDACIGGCTNSSSNCWACRNKLNGDTCISSCPPKHQVNQMTSRQELNPEFKYDMHDICVKECPEPLLKMETVCVIECDFKTTMPINGTCVPCTTSPCANHCVQQNIFENGFPLMTSEAAKKFRECYYYSGAIYISKESFKPRKGRDALKIEDLWNLRTLREIVGYIYIDLKGIDIPLRNLSFLENLYKVTTEFSGGVTLQRSLIIHDANNLEFLGLKSLQYMDFMAMLNGLPSLCYTSALDKVLPVIRQSVKDPAECVKEGHVCHSECLPEAGCWGPGPTMCARCCTFDADGVCVATCSDAPGFYLPPNTSAVTPSGFRCPTLQLTPEQVASMEIEDVMASIKPAIKCARCHEECEESCTGPEANQCIGECKNFRSYDTCVRRCSQDQYADDKICLPCNSKCLPPLKSELPGGVSACSGAHSHLGIGGCTFCHFVQRDRVTSKYQCLDTRCPPQHFGNSTYLKHLNLKKEELSVENTEVANIAFQECIPCHPECEICAGPGNHISVCQKCKNWMYRSECVSACPSDDTYMPNLSKLDHLSDREKKMLEMRECLRCHEQCSGGCTAFGPEFCKNCRYAKIVIDANQFICNSTCPPELYRMENTNLCLNSEQYEKMLGANATRSRNQALIAAGIILLFLLIFSLMFAVLCFNYKAKRSRIKEALKSTYTNIKAPDMKDAKSSREPNMGRWEMINIDDLSFDENKTLIGKGAFGEVYRGKWRVPKRVLNQFNLARGTSLDVAIKVISSTTSASFQGGPTPNLGVTGSDSSSSASQLDANAVDRITTRSNLQDMLAEAKVMASVQHKNCLPLIGVCLTRKMQCMVSMFVEEGSLDRYVRLHKDDLNSFTLLSWAEQIADGMAYLEERGIIHRDLAARNVLVQSSEHVQITDFGLAKMLENSDESSVVVRTGRVPIRWLAIETLQSGIYSHKTDVWSYGVTLWEIFTFGKQPYENIATADIKDHVMKGVRLTQPEICTLDTYMVMVRCWMEEQESRPTFLELMKCFHKYCQTPGRYLYIEGDEYAINRTTPYTPSPAPWTELKPLPSTIRGVPDGVAGPSNGGVGYAFKFPEESFFDYHHVTRTGENGSIPEAESLLPRRAGIDPLLRRFFSHSIETRTRSISPSNGRHDRVTTANSLLSTNLDTWPNGSGIGANFNPSTQEMDQQQPKYYNTSAFLGSGTYGPLVRPPSPPPPLAETEHNDDLEIMTKSGNRGAEINYLSTLNNSTDVGELFEAEPPPDEYLEPRSRGSIVKPAADACAVGNPNYFQINQGYLQPTGPSNSAI